MLMPDQDPRQATVSAQARETRALPEIPVTRPVAKPARRSWWWRLLWLVILLAAAVELGLWFAGRQSSAPTPAATRAQAAASIQVGVATVTTGDIPVTLDELGTVTPLATVTVKSQVSGHITDIKFQEGQIVQKGDLLIVIDVRPFTIALQLAQATLAHDQALLANARVDLARFQKLIEQDFVAKQTLDTQRFLVTQDEATVQLDQAAVDNAKLNSTTAISPRPSPAASACARWISAISSRPAATPSSSSPRSSRSPSSSLCRRTICRR